MSLELFGALCRVAIRQNDLAIYYAKSSELPLDNSMYSFMVQTCHNKVPLRYQATQIECSAIKAGLLGLTIRRTRKREINVDIVAARQRSTCRSKLLL